ncbi:MAG TPA: DUF6263 family protein [Planctomycetota bacterium]|nr:DUF6263 family protein [Planctomycetota bacterium]
MKPFAAALLLALVPLPAPARESQAKAELRWKWQKGQEAVYKSVQKTLLDLGGQPADQQMGYKYSMTVENVAESGEATITVKYLAVSAKAGPLLGNYDYDSEKDPEPGADSPASAAARMVGQSFTMKMTPVGIVTEVLGYDKVLDAVTKGAGSEAAAARARLKQMLNSETFKGMMQQMAPPLPEEKVGKGDTWNTDFVVKMALIGTMSFAMKSTMTDLKDADAHIDQDITIELKGGGKDNSLAGLVEIKGGKGKSTAVFSTEKGCFLSQKSAIELTIVSDGQPLAMKMVNELTLVSRK